MADSYTDDLADRLDADASDLDGSVAALVDDDLLVLVVPAVRLRSVASMQVAAAELRRLRHRDAALTTLLDAVGDADSLRLMADNLMGIGWVPEAEAMSAVAAAVEGIDQEHER